LLLPSDGVRQILCPMPREARELEKIK